MTPDGRNSQTTRVTVDALSRLPVEHLARLLLDRAAEDPMLLRRLHASLAAEPPRASFSLAAGTPLIGSSAAMAAVLDLLHRFERNDDPVLITGESGTGKELAARTIHAGSARRGGPFVAVNCAAIPASLVASELFGYEKGAFTGAATRTRGQLEHAEGGTLFLDEIGDMPLELQGHLLRFLQEGQIVRVGGREAVTLNVRIVSATHVNLRQAIAAGRFREDLFYRLNVLHVRLPPLRERPEDIEPLALHFLAEARRDLQSGVAGFEPAALARLCRHAWPGNVRELRSVIRRAVVVGETGRIGVEDLGGFDDQAPPVSLTLVPSPSRPTVLPPGSDAERTALLAALQRFQENVTLASQSLGVSRVTLYRMLRRHRIALKRGLQAAPVGVSRAAMAGSGAD
jgi:DNA-binding NtrC family response regulator